MSEIVTVKEALFVGEFEERRERERERERERPNLHLHLGRRMQTFFNGFSQKDGIVGSSVTRLGDFKLLGNHFILK